MQNSTQPKKTGRGGARANAGRKPKPAKHVKAPTECVAAAILDKIGVQQRIETLLTITDPTNKEMRTRFAASPTLYMRSIEQHWEILEGLMNRAWGKAKQAVEHSGSVDHNHTVPETTTPAENDERLADIFALAIKRAAQLPAGAGKERSARAAEAEG